MQEPVDLIVLQEAPIDAGAAIGSAGQRGTGGVAVFLGLTRSEDNSDGRPLVALDYEAYREMAHSQMKQLAEEARKRWSIGRIILIHRIGSVAVGEVSVLIAVSTPHRKEAFQACQYLIDTLKERVAIWKKEVWADGATSWVHPGRMPGDG